MTIKLFSSRESKYFPNFFDNSLHVFTFFFYFNESYIYIDGLLRNWKHKADAGILLRRKFYLHTLLFADDQVVIQDSEDKPPKFLYISKQTSKIHNLKISTDETKIMAFKGKHLARSKIEIDGSILEQVKQFNYLGCEPTLDGETD